MTHIQHIIHVVLRLHSPMVCAHPHFELLCHFLVLSALSTHLSITHTWHPYGISKFYWLYPYTHHGIFGAVHCYIYYTRPSIAHSWNYMVLIRPPMVLVRDLILLSAKSTNPGYLYGVSSYVCFTHPWRLYATSQFYLLRRPLMVLPWQSIALSVTTVHGTYVALHSSITHPLSHSTCIAPHNSVWYCHPRPIALVSIA